MLMGNRAFVIIQILINRSSLNSANQTGGPHDLGEVDEETCHVFGG